MVSNPYILLVTIRSTSRNFVYGPFGGSTGNFYLNKFNNNLFADRDYICVQSLDGVLYFFEQESFSFVR
jgi:hypothetical protein